MFKKKLTAVDKSLVGSVLILSLIGVGAVFVSGYHLSLKNRGYPYYYGYNHILTLLAAVPVTAAIVCVPLRLWKKFSVPLFFFTLFLSVLVFFPGIGKRVSGASRWISMSGLSFQPSEILKLGMIGCLSFMIVNKEGHINHLVRGIIPLFLVIVVSTGVVALEPDLSTAVIIFITGFFLIYINRIRFTYLAFTVAMLLPFFLYIFESKSYFFTRFYFFLADLDPHGRGYHILQALKSYRLGGLFGISDDFLLSQAMYFPDIHTDFIFSMLARIGGIVLVLFTLILFAFMLYRCFRISVNQEDAFARNLGLGITFLFTLEIIVHIAVNVGLAPTTGSVLPFISYGRTAILTHAVMLGVILNLSAESNKRIYLKKEKEEITYKGKEEHVYSGLPIDYV